MRDVVFVEVVLDYEIRYRFVVGGEWRDLLVVIVEFLIFLKVYYVIRKFDEMIFELFLGSGFYKVGMFDVGCFIEYEWVLDYWVKDLLVNVGWWNFDMFWYDYFCDWEIVFEVFKFN